MRHDFIGLRSNIPRSHSRVSNLANSAIYCGLYEVRGGLAARARISGGLIGSYDSEVVAVLAVRTSLSATSVTISEPRETKVELVKELEPGRNTSTGEVALGQGVIMELAVHATTEINT